MHTPCSIVQHFGDDNDVTWDRYLGELEQLPDDIRVIGINDYWFLDGYRRVLEAKLQGRLPNIEEIFPVVETRLDLFSGVQGPWQRVNFHVVFDPELGPDVIEQQFIAALTNSFDLDPNSKGSTWSGAVTRESLRDLGKHLKASVPQSELANYGSDLREGFNNLVVPLAAVKRVLDSSYLRGRCLVGVGRAEWANIKWADGSIASKKSAINYADFVFTASQDITTWSDIVEKLKTSNVTHKLLDCSDAHHWSDSDQNERLGRCSTWINAAPSFAGLCHALSEFDERVFVGLEPPVRARVRTHPQHFIDRVWIGSSDDSKFEAFSYELPLNAGFVSIIGNKGQGKSALLDCIALAGNSSRTSEFAFLNAQRFLSPANRSAKEYFAELTWADGTERRRGFAEGFEPSAPVQVEYLPQAFVERLCTAVPKSAADDEFESELRSILFTHIPDEDRAGAATFDELLERRTRSSSDKIEAHRRDLLKLIDEFLGFARFRAEQALPDVEAKIATRTAEVSAAQVDLDAATAELARLEAESSANPELAKLTEDATRLAALRDSHLAEQDRLRAAAGVINQNLLLLGSLEQRIENLQAEALALNAEAEALLMTLPEGWDPSTHPVLSVSVDTGVIDAWRQRADMALSANTAETLAAEQSRAEAEAALSQVSSQLATQDSVRELSRQKVLQCTERVKDLVGDEGVVDSLRGLQALRARVEAAPVEMDAKKQELLIKAAQVHEALRDQLESVTDLYAPAAAFIADSRAIAHADLEFKAELRLVPSLAGLASQIDGRKSPELGPSISSLPSRVGATDWPDIAEQLEAAIDALSRERGAIDGEYRDPDIAMRTGSTASGFISAILDLHWIEVRFGLTGGGVPLSQLSPGQRGLVLALFYLVVDRRETPLLLDQPEENLDNETISNLLVPALREAAGRRQTIVVTHNANLAVVGDADQIVHCSLVDDRFTVDAGSISELETAEHAVNVLEGTMPSFSKRRSKWEVHHQLSS